MFGAAWRATRNAFSPRPVPGLSVVKSASRLTSRGVAAGRYAARNWPAAGMTIDARRPPTLKLETPDCGCHAPPTSALPSPTGTDLVNESTAIGPSGTGGAVVVGSGAVRRPAVHVPVPWSVNVFPATGWKSQSYPVGDNVSEITP